MSARMSKEDVWSLLNEYFNNRMSIDEFITTLCAPVDESEEVLRFSGKVQTHDAYQKAIKCGLFELFYPNGMGAIGGDICTVIVTRNTPKPGPMIEERIKKAFSDWTFSKPKRHVYQVDETNKWSVSEVGANPFVGTLAETTLYIEKRLAELENQK